MQRLQVSGAVRPLYGSLGFKGLTTANKASIQTIVYSLKKALLEPKRVAATVFWQKKGAYVANLVYLPKYL
jgi:hypothetical protein